MGEGMRRLWVAVLFFGLGWVAIHKGFFLFVSASEIAARLQASAVNTLREHGHDWAVIDMQGQRAHVSGVASSERSRDDALAIVRRAAGPGGAIMGGVTRVIDDVDVLPVADPYRLFARWDGRTAVITGHAPHRDDVAALRAQARTLGVSVDMSGITLAAGAPEDFSWARAMRFGFTQLVKLEAGSLALDGNTLRLTGLAGSAGVVEEVDGVLTLPPPELAALAMEAGVSLQPSAVPLLGRSADPAVAACSAALYEALAGETIGFYPGSESVSVESLDALDRLAQAAGGCAPLRIRVEAHTGRIGDPIINRDLSERRAEEVARQLAARGVDANRLETTGHGSDLPRPVDGGRGGDDARVEFTVTS